MSTYAIFFSAVLGIDELFANISEGRERVRAGKVGAWEVLVFSDWKIMMGSMSAGSGISITAAENILMSQDAVGNDLGVLELGSADLVGILNEMLTRNRSGFKVGLR